MSQQPEETVGLDLFDETASAAGSFPHSMLGYERQAVDAYIRDIERQLSSAKRKVRSLQRQLATKADETDYSRLGTHTGDLLRNAEREAARTVRRHHGVTLPASTAWASPLTLTVPTSWLTG